MLDGKKVTAIILIAGNSTRYGQNRNKNLELIHGKCVFTYSLRAFDSNSYVDDIIIAYKEEEYQTVKEIVAKENIRKNVEFVLGGETRRDSVYHCLEKTQSEIVIIHDGARPAIKQIYINQCIESMNEFSGVTIGVRSKDTIKITDDNQVVRETTKRANSWLIQTPQCLDRSILKRMHEEYQKEEVTDDCMLLEKDGYPVKVIQGDYTNIKITTFDDMEYIKNYFNNGGGRK